MDKAIPIQSREGAHFGFMLIAGNEGSEGECVFMPVPKDPAAFENPDFLFLRQFGAKECGEHKWCKDGNVVSIELTTGDRASMDLSARSLVFNGKVHFQIA